MNSNGHALTITPLAHRGFFALSCECGWRVPVQKGKKASKRRHARHVRVKTG